MTTTATLAFATWSIDVALPGLGPLGRLRRQDPPQQLATLGGSLGGGRVAGSRASPASSRCRSASSTNSAGLSSGSAAEFSPCSMAFPARTARRLVGDDPQRLHQSVRPAHGDEGDRHEEERDRDQQVAGEVGDRLLDLLALDLGDHRPLEAVDVERAPGLQHVGAEVAGRLDEIWFEIQRLVDVVVVDRLEDDRRAEHLHRVDLTLRSPLPLRPRRPDSADSSSRKPRASDRIRSSPATTNVSPVSPSASHDPPFVVISLIRPGPIRSATKPASDPSAKTGLATNRLGSSPAAV